jgi:hypothetical protein
MRRDELAVRPEQPLQTVGDRDVAEPSFALGRPEGEVRQQGPPYPEEAGVEVDVVVGEPERFT